MIFTEKTIQAQLMWHALAELQHRLAVPNTRGLFNYEADCATVTKADFVHEWEIKLTVADFKADFKNKPHKHRVFAERAIAPLTSNQPNYFWFVIPHTIVDQIEPLVPEYAGLLVVTDRIHFHHSVLVHRKEAPRLHECKMQRRDEEYMMRSMSYHLASQIAAVHPIMGHR